MVDAGGGWMFTVFIKKHKLVLLFTNSQMFFGEKKTLTGQITEIAP